MKKVISIFLCIMIFAIPCFVFADNSSYDYPLILPLGDSSTVNLSFKNPFSRSDLYLWSNHQTYYYVFSLNDEPYFLYFSQEPNTRYYYSTGSGVGNGSVLNSQYNGFYYSGGYNSSSLPDDIILKEFTGSITDVLDYINESVFSTSFNLTYLVNGSVSWLSSMAQAVKANGLLLFLCLVGFVGISIGLLKRFERG